MHLPVEKRVVVYNECEVSKNLPSSVISKMIRNNILKAEYIQNKNTVTTSKIFKKSVQNFKFL
jgi:hypothetical protein